MKQHVFTLLFSFFLLGNVHAIEKIQYQAAFNPVKGLINEVEKEQRYELCLNGTWDFMPVYNVKAPDFKLPSDFKWDNTPIKIPSPWNVNAFTDGLGGDFIAYPSYPKQWEEAKVGWMRKKVTIPSDWNSKQMILHFEAIMGKALIYVNGEKVAENFELFLPFEADVTQFLKPGQENEILVGVAKGDLFDDRGRYGRRTYVGGSMWGIEMAGIWQDVYLFALPQVHVEDIFIQPDVKNNRLKIELNIVNTTDKKVSLNISGDVKKWYNRAGLSIHEIPEQKGELAETASLIFPELKKVAVEANSSRKVTLSASVDGKLNYWTPESVELYGAVVQLKEGKNVLDTKYERFGWRQFDISGNRLLLNGEPISLKGDSWHFLGVPQMTRRYAWAWFTMLKDVSANAVRFHAQPFPRFYLDMADEMGICVLDETGIWSSDGGPKIDSEEYWESCAEHIRRLIKRDKNHASVFGWSVCNETVPVAVHVFKAPEELVQRQLDEINRWVKITQEADPTRVWISGDGETDRPTILPTVIGHYGGTEGMLNWSKQGKPWGIGEQSMAYYGTPKQASAYNGNRAYESMLGRMEAIAIESYDLIKIQRENNASYSSIFNLAWYALQPLELGLKDITRAPDMNDGIFFGFKESIPGMQPERLGPYTTTLNPGYDPSLPLYRSWPLLDAIRCANATPMLPNPVKAVEEKNISFPIVPADAIVLYAAEGSRLKEDLEVLGLSVSDTKPTHNTLVIIDGIHPPATDKQSANIKKAIEVGARILVIGIAPESLPVLNKLIPYPIELEERKATSFLVMPASKELQGLTHADFYFSELIPRGKTAMNYGLAGDFGMKADLLLRACNTDWQRWNYRPETSKTGNVFRSEREAKGSDIAIASLPIGNGQFIVSTLDLKDIKQETQPILTKLLVNLGAQVSSANLSKLQTLDEKACLRRALVWGPYHTQNKPTADLLTTDYIKGEGSLVPELNLETQGETWKVVAGDEENFFEFSNAKASGDARTPIVYMSFWVYSPRSLSNLLAEPDMPSMDMFLSAQGGVVVWLNGNKTFSHEIVEGENDVKIPNIMLDKGWNHFVVKFVRQPRGGSIQTSIRFDSTDKVFMKQILSSVVR